MTGLSNDVRSIRIEEYFDCVHQANPSTLALIGLGGDPSEAMTDASPALFYQRQYWFQMIEQMAATMGVELSRIVTSARSRS
jgi:hypothetical protein